MRLIGGSKVLVICGAVTALVIGPSSPARAQQVVGVFERMSGQWTGEGTVRMTNGGSERIRCRATYRVHSGSSSLRQEMLRASDSYKFQVTSDPLQSAEKITGQWVEMTRNVSGSVTGQVTGNLIQARVQGEAFAASFAVSRIEDPQAYRVGRGQHGGAGRESHGSVVPFADHRRGSARRHRLAACI